MGETAFPRGPNLRRLCVPSVHRGLLSFVVFLSGCTLQASPEPRAEVSSAILHGTPSGADDNASVFIESETSPTTTLQCSGTLIAPNLVLTARHCTLKANVSDFRCTMDGESLADPTGKHASDTVDSKALTVRYGETTSSEVRAQVLQIILPEDYSLCRSDLAILRLDHPLAERYASVDFHAPKLGDTFSVLGWGFTNDGQKNLPGTRSRRDNLAVQDVGPGQMPAGHFSIVGNSMCFGDSGAAAFRQGAVVGVYSRILGSNPFCGLDSVTNLFVSVHLFEAFLRGTAEKAHATLWVAGTPPPWGAPGPPQDASIGACGIAPCGPSSSTPSSSSGCAVGLALDRREASWFWGSFSGSFSGLATLLFGAFLPWLGRIRIAGRKPRKTVEHTR